MVKKGKILTGRIDDLTMQGHLIHVFGVVARGHQVASGPSKEYPYGSMERQIPLFKEKGLDLEGSFLGTINICIAPLQFEMIRPAFTFRQVAWTDLHPPEDFSFSPCKLKFDGKRYDGFVYFPHPETKIRHFQDASIIEVISVKIPGIWYGSRVELLLDPVEIRIHTGKDQLPETSQ
jgi:hypothetical protein